MTFNITSLQAADTVGELLNWANMEATEGLMAPVLLIALFIVLLLIMRSQPIDDSLTVASFVCLILSLFMTYMELLNFVWVIRLAAMTAFAVLYQVVKRQAGI